MTVAAVILAATVESALADADGTTRIRRIAEAAWAGGATPIVVVAPDPDGAVATALAGAPVVQGAPVDGGGPVTQIAHAIDLARADVGATTAAMIWPARLCWAGPETVTSLVEAHGIHGDALLRPAYRGELGWPALLPVALLPALRGLSATAMPDDLLAALVASGDGHLRTLDLGDPGTVLDGSVPRGELPPYDGPREPVGATAPDWGEDVAATADAPAALPRRADAGPGGS